MFGLLKTHRLVYRQRQEVGAGVWSLAFDAHSPLHARAGQHGLLRLPGGGLKPFSLASAPEEPTVLIGTSLHSGSNYKKRLAALRPGDRVTLQGPIMRFTLDGAADHVVMLAQGVGITPMRSMLQHLALTGAATRTELVHVAPAGHAYRADTEAAASTASYVRHAQQFRTATTAAAHAEPDATFYVAGAPSFVSDTAKLLTAAGVHADNIRLDKYYGYKPRPAATRTAAETGK